jgi:hypothetical protein
MHIKCAPTMSTGMVAGDGNNCFFYCIRVYLLITNNCLNACSITSYGQVLAFELTRVLGHNG